MTTLYSLLLVAAGAVIAYFAEQFSAWLKERALPFVPGLRGSRSDYSDMFRESPAHLDVLVFTISGRPFLPLTDLLYLSYIRHLLMRNRAKKAFIFVWHEDATLNGPEWIQFDRLLTKIFEPVADRVNVVSSRQERFADDGRPPTTFWKTLDVLCSRQFIDYANSHSAKVSRLEEMNKARPTNVLLKGIVGHALQNSYIISTVLDELSQYRSAEDDRPNLGVLCWEVEIDRLGVFYQAMTAGDSSRFPHSFDLFPVLGKTVPASRRKPSDNHTSHVAISTVLPVREQVERVSAKRRREARRYVEIVELLLKEYEVENIKSKSRESAGRDLCLTWTGNSPKMNRSAAELIYLLHEFQTGLRSLQNSTAINGSEERA